MSWYSDWLATAAARGLTGTLSVPTFDEDQWAVDGDPSGLIGFWELSASVPVVVTGLLGGKIGRQVVVVNNGGESILLAHAQLSDKSSVATDIVLAPETGALLWIEPTTVQFSVLQTQPDPAPTIDYKPIAELGPMASARLVGRTSPGSGPAEELTAAAVMTLLGAQPLDSDLTAIAALATTSFGRGFLTLADAAAARTLISAQPVDSDLTAIAALTTTSYGRALLTLADAAATRSAIDAQQADADLTAIAALTTTSFGRSFLPLADAAAARTLISAQQLDSDLTAIAALATTSFGRSVLALADAAAARSLFGAGTSNLVLASTGTPADLGPTASRGSTGTAADAGHVHRAPGATNGLVVIGGGGFTTAASTAVQDPSLGFVAPVSGVYLVSVNSRISSGVGHGGIIGYLYIGGVLTYSFILEANGIAKDELYAIAGIPCTATAGQTVGFRLSKNAAGVAVILGGGQSTISYALVCGP